MPEGLPQPEIQEEISSLVPEEQRGEEEGLVDELFPGSKVLEEVVEKYTPTEEFVLLEKEAREAANRILSNGGSKEDVGAVLKAWKYSYELFDEIYWSQTRENMSYMFYWDGKVQEYDRSMNVVLGTGVRDYRNRTASSENVEYSGIGRVEGLLFDQEFEEQEEMLDYLVYRIWLANKLVKETRTYPVEKDSSIYHSKTKINLRNIRAYEQEKEYILPLIIAKTKEFAQEGNTEIVRRVLKNLETMGEDIIAADLLAAEDLNDEARLNIAVQHMNVFGVVPTIDEISSREENNEALKRLYRTLQGEDIESVMKSLTEVYKSVDFHEYVLNNPELTERESNIVQRQIESYAEKEGKPVHEVRIIDIGAGTGRHALALHKKGYDVTALDYENHHLEKIREQDPSIKTAAVDWQRMPYPDGKHSHDISPEVFYCLGRTILHNNTPEKMAHYFDEMQRVLGEKGVGIIDIPKIPVERVDEVRDDYSEEIRRYTDHLVSLGVEPGVAKNIFDGPDEKHKYNRMALTDKQFRAYAKLFGFKVTQAEDIPIEDTAMFDNSYYVIEKDPEFMVDYIDPKEFSDAFGSVGLLDPGVDYNRHVDAWEVPLGIPIFFMSGSRPEMIDKIRNDYESGRLGKINTRIDDNIIYFDFSHIQ